MPKRKLRNCVKCGVRHGPPIGTRCKREGQEFERLNEEMGDSVTATVGEAAEAEDARGVEMTFENSTSLGMVPEFPFGLEGDQDPGNEEQWRSFSEFRRRREEERRASGWVGPPAPPGPEMPPPPPPARAQPQSGERGEDPVKMSTKQKKPAGKGGQEAPSVPPRSQGIYYQVPWEHYPQHLQGHHRYPPYVRVGTQRTPASYMAAGQESGSEGVWSSSGGGMENRMSRLETSLAEMMDTQRTLLQYQADMWARSQPAQTAPEASKAQVKKDDSSDSDTEPESEEWKESFGDDLWKNVKFKRDKNPFEQSSYLKKGEAVDSFERVVLIIFKTIAQLVENGGDVKGVVRHGLAMAEKAAKGVYKIEAFVKYDESVRERAGAVGPGAFGTVDQEDTLRFFSYDNVERAKSWKAGSGSSSGAGKKRSDKMCLKYNDQGCNAKSCYFVHKCAACEELGHCRKDCKNLKKKDK